MVRNWDHVFPASWYPEETAANLEKWQVPSCVPCNSKYGKIESDFLSRVGLSLDPFHPASRSVVQSALRSLKGSAGRNPRDSSLRVAKGKRILSEALHGADIPHYATVPGMGERWGRPVEEQIAVLVPAESVRLMTEKIVRGIFYVEDEKFIEPPFKIDFFLLNDEAANEWRQILDRHAVIFARPPGLVVRRAVVPEDKTSAMFEILFWQQFATYATVSVPNRR